MNSRPRGRARAGTKARDKGGVEGGGGGGGGSPRGGRGQAGVGTRKERRRKGTIKEYRREGTRNKGRGHEDGEEE